MFGCLGPRRLRAGQNLDPLFCQGSFQRLRNFSILDRQDVRQHLDQRHLRAKGIIEIGELDPDRSRADDHHALRLWLENHRFPAANHFLSVERQSRQRPRNHTGSDQDLRCGVRLGFAIGKFHHNLARPIEQRFTAHIIDFVFLEEEFDPGRVLVRDVARTFDHLAPIVGKTFNSKAKVVRTMFHQVIQLGIAQERFGWDAAPVETGAAGPFLLDAGDTLPKLRGTNRADVAGRPAANHD